MWLTLFRYERIEPINTQYARTFTRYTKNSVHNFHPFEKVEWNKLVQAEIKARKYVLDQRRKSQSNAGAAN